MMEPQLEKWLIAEQALVQQFDAEASRASGMAAAEMGKWTSSLMRLNEAVRGGKTDIETLDALGEIAYRSGAAEALMPYQRLYRQPEISVHLARAFFMIGDLSEAESILSLSRPSKLVEAMQALLAAASGYEEAHLRPMIEVAKRYPDLDFPDFWKSVGAIAEYMGEPLLAQSGLQKAIRSSWRSPEPHFNYAIHLLNKGEYRAAWREYEYRMHPDMGKSTYTTHLLLDIPLWMGENLKGRRILVALEQGLGDQIWSLRFIRQLMMEGAQVEIACTEHLFDLLDFNFARDGVQIHRVENVHRADYWMDERPKPDYWVPSFSVPGRLGIHAPDAHPGYLNRCVDGSVLLALQGLGDSALIKIRDANLPVKGIVWHGNIMTEYMRTRAYSIEEFVREAGVMDEPAVIVILQKDITNEEYATLLDLASAHECELVDLRGLLNTFRDTAYWMSLCNALHLVDTSVAHLAGALGLNATVYVKNTAIWQWRADAEGRAEWYGSIRVVTAANTTRITWEKVDYKRLEGSSEMEMSPSRPAAPQRHGGLRIAGAGGEKKGAVIPENPSSLPAREPAAVAPEIEGLKLNIGCGFNQKASYVNIDQMAACKPDMVMNLEEAWSLADDSAGLIEASHVLEHLGQTTEAYLRFMKEMYRVCRHGALIKIAVPHPNHVAFQSDPTHVRPITPQGLQLFDKKLNVEWRSKGYANTPLGIYCDVDFELLEAIPVMDSAWASRSAEEQSFALQHHMNSCIEWRMTLRVRKEI